MTVYYVNRDDIGILFKEENPLFIPNAGDVISVGGKIYDVTHRHRMNSKEVEVYVDPSE